MNRINVSSTSPHLERRVLRGPVPPHFETFYRATLRFRVGSRLGSTNLRARYLAWAEAAGAPSLGFRAIGVAMRAIGHRHAHSNGIYYADAALASDVPDIADNYPSLCTQPSRASVLDRLDAVAAELAAIRDQVAAA